MLNKPFEKIVKGDNEENADKSDPWVERNQAFFI